MAHNVKCLYCGLVFDAKPNEEGKVWYKPRTNRYAHKQCGDHAQDNLTQEQKDFHELYQYVKNEQKENFNYVQFDKITKSWIKEYGYTYSGMLKSLLYFYEVKKNSKQKLKEGSIGIIPFCYVQAYNYYYDIYTASQQAGQGNYNKTAARHIDINAPIARAYPPKLFNLEDSNEK